MHFQILLSRHRVLAKIHRYDDGFYAAFTVINAGRLRGSILSSLIEDNLQNCIMKCVKHLSCKTVNYNSKSGECDLNRDGFSKDDSQDLVDWRNYGTPEDVSVFYLIPCLQFLKGRCIFNS